MDDSRPLFQGLWEPSACALRPAAAPVLDARVVSQVLDCPGREPPWKRGPGPPLPPSGGGAEEEAREAAAGRGWVVRALGVGWARFPGPPGPANNGRLWKEAAGMQPGESGGGAAAAAGRGRGAAAASYLSR